MERICNPIGKRTRRPGLSLVEVVLSMLIASIMLVAALSTVGASRLSQFKTSQTTRGQALAESLMTEILRQDYQDPDGTPLFGLEQSEPGGQRNKFDDVDDYDGWTKSPPRDKNGSIIPNCDGWRRTVTVAWVDPMDPSLVEDSESNAKRVTITVTFQDMPVATLVAIRTAWE